VRSAALRFFLVLEVTGKSEDENEDEPMPTLRQFRSQPSFSAPRHWRGDPFRTASAGPIRAALRKGDKIDFHAAAKSLFSAGTCPQ